MEGPILEHSDDSESGDSWTLLEHNPTYGDDVPDVSEIHESNKAANPDKDEDTDGISIISDNESDSPSLCQANYENSTPEEYYQTENANPQCTMANPMLNVNNNQESIREEDDFLSINNVKHKTYVHRRNKRLSTVLNIIVLGSVITAAGVAIGHMWGVKTDCSMHTIPNVNKILSNLYKLQEENAFLRAKLKEFTTLSSYQLNLQKEPFKPNKCKKMFEESLNNDNINKPTKCLDYRIDKSFKKHLVQPAYEKEFLSDIDKLKNVYLQNKSWLDDEVNQRMKQKEQSFQRFKNKHTSRFDKKDLIKKDSSNEKKTTEESIDDVKLQDDSKKDINNLTFQRKSYADSLKTKKTDSYIRNENIQIPKVDNKDKNKNKKVKSENVPISDYSVSEEKLQKDNRYNGQKNKPEKKKQDRQKLNKKQKRKNKYEQWEMKGGFMKDYDEISFASLQDNDVLSKDKNIKNDANVIIQVEDNNVDKHFDKLDKSEIDYKTESEMTKHDKDYKKDNVNEVESHWYEKRAIHRTEARKKLEHELFGDSPSTAGWYFRRMNKREQCRAKGDNSTYRKMAKRKMNFKMKQ